MTIKDGIYTFEQLIQFPSLVHGISTRKFGSMKKKKEIQWNAVRKFTQRLDLNAASIILSEQVHGNTVVKLTDELQEKIIKGADALMTKKKGVGMGVVTADCLPVILYDPKKNIAGVIHAGYKGLLKNIISEMILKFTAEGSESKNIYVCVGPGIERDCYKVAQDRINAFRSEFPAFTKYYSKKNDRFFLDLRRVALLQLLENKIDTDHIEISDLCTRCHMDLLYSYRGEGADTYGEFMTVVALK